VRTDTIFYQLFQSYPSLLFELAGLPPEMAAGGLGLVATVTLTNSRV